MAQHTADIVIAGAGLSAALAALRLGAAGRVLLIDQRPDPLAGHTWSFHDGDLDPAQRDWLGPAVRRRWNGQDVRFPGYARRLRSGYASLDADSLGAAISGLPGIGRLTARVASVDATGVVLADGRRIEARIAIDARGFVPHPAIEVRFQKFLGQEVRLTAPHGLTRPVIMDATVPQQDGYRFFYLLPFDDMRLLIEETYYSDRAVLSPERQRGAIADYAAAQGWRIAQVDREETGVLPIALRFDADAFWKAQPPVPAIGLRAMRFHPLTGYSLPQAVRSADLIARHWQQGPQTLALALRRLSLHEARAQGFYRLLSRMLFEAADPDRRRHVMQRFYRLPEPLIERLYAGTSTLADKARILTGRPPVPVGRALRCLPETFKVKPA
ncbi:lycopene cyclase [Paracoccus sediminis]|uniref:Lycopene beta-cyclase n=1 Tax=Paracoccus sediminis TaxID=1214787 RepID=A0A238WG15_9RHOB|nr:lycopene beta-cyclase CrtY [Paracoccus sediminis]TBN50883.1 lycopene cyclase [Paracoccus sediminis]SNR45164.1 lycopene beta-cyclase [Paracoccus sediminis]